MKYAVLLTDDAVQDLEMLYDYIYHHDSPESAEYVLDQIEDVFSSLEEHPECGAYPNELLSIGLREYREVYFKPYRVIYRVISPNVYVMVVADGRRDMQSLLERRLLSAK